MKIKMLPKLKKRRILNILEPFLIIEKYHKKYLNIAYVLRVKIKNYNQNLKKLRQLANQMKYLLKIDH